MVTIDTRDKPWPRSAQQIPEIEGSRISSDTSTSFYLVMRETKTSRVCRDSVNPVPLLTCTTNLTGKDLIGTGWSTKLSETSIVLEGVTSSLVRASIVSEQCTLGNIDIPASLAVLTRSDTKLPSNTPTAQVVTNGLRKPSSIQWTRPEGLVSSV